jgi:hypothetical protein
MTIVKWQVSPYTTTPDRKEYDSETKCFYLYRTGRMSVARRDAKLSTYYRYFDSEAEALEFIRQRAENKNEQKRIDRIKGHGIELLEVLEEVIKHYPFPDSVIANNAKHVIAKAKGEA